MYNYVTYHISHIYEHIHIYFVILFSETQKLYMLTKKIILFILKRFYLFIFRNLGREGEREGEKG